MRADKKYLSKEAYQKLNIDEIEVVLSRIKIKTKNFYQVMKDKWGEDLEYILNQLNEIESSIDDKYMSA